MIHKDNVKKEDLKMNVAISKKNDKFTSEAVRPSATLFPLLGDSQDDICSNISRSLFKLEKDVALFQFVIKEIKDIK